MGGEASGSRCGGLAEAGREGWLPVPRGPAYPETAPPPQQAHSHTLISHTPAHPTASTFSRSQDDHLTLHTSRQTQTTRAFPRPHPGTHTQARGPRAHFAQQLAGMYACTHTHAHAHAQRSAQTALARTPHLAGFCGLMLPRRCRPPRALTRTLIRSPVHTWATGCAHAGQ